MIRIYQQTIIVSPEVIDGNGHVNNTIYLHWMQDIAIAHSSANGWSPERYREIKTGWFARSHYLEYLRPAFASDQLMVRTWASGFAKTRSVRQYQIDRHQTVIFQARTEWVYFDSNRQRPARPPRNLVESFEVVTDIERENL